MLMIIDNRTTELKYPPITNNKFVSDCTFVHNKGVSKIIFGTKSVLVRWLMPKIQSYIIYKTIIGSLR